jgi:type II secretory pathway pseudopilin PulG
VIRDLVRFQLINYRGVDMIQGLDEAKKFELAGHREQQFVEATRKSRFFKAPMKKLQRGISMVELSVVLVVVALISAGVFYGMKANQRRVEIQDNVGQITEMAAELKKKFGRSNQYGAVTTALAVQSRAVPEQLRTTPTTAQNSYGGAIQVAPSTCSTVNDCVDIIWPGIPRDQCMDLIIGAQGGARFIDIGGVAVKPLDDDLDIGVLAGSCEAGLASAMIFRIGR